MKISFRGSSSKLLAKNLTKLVMHNLEIVTGKNKKKRIILTYLDEEIFLRIIFFSMFFISFIFLSTIKLFLDE